MAEYALHVEETIERAWQRARARGIIGRCDLAAAVWTDAEVVTLLVDPQVWQRVGVPCCLKRVLENEMCDILCEMAERAAPRPLSAVPPKLQEYTAANPPTAASAQEIVVRRQTASSNN